MDLTVVHRIKSKAFENGKVMDHLFFLTDVGGPRLTASRGERQAADWAVSRLKGWGISSARTELWGRFGRGWQLKRYAATCSRPATRRSPASARLVGRHAQPVTADVVLAPVFRWEEILSDPAKIEARVREYAFASAESSAAASCSCSRRWTRSPPPPQP